MPRTWLTKHYGHNVLHVFETAFILARRDGVPMPVIHLPRWRSNEASEAEPEMHRAEVVATMFESRVALAPVCLQSLFLLRTNDGKMMKL